MLIKGVPRSDLIGRIGDGSDWQRMLYICAKSISGQSERRIDTEATSASTEPLIVESLQTPVAPGGASMCKLAIYAFGVSTMAPFNDPSSADLVRSP